jgi:hypothetical protein
VKIFERSIDFTTTVTSTNMTCSAKQERIKSKEQSSVQPFYEENTYEGGRMRQKRVGNEEIWREGAN